MIVRRPLLLFPLVGFQTGELRPERRGGSSFFFSCVFETLSFLKFNSLSRSPLLGVVSPVLDQRFPSPFSRAPLKMTTPLKFGFTTLGKVFERPFKLFDCVPRCAQPFLFTAARQVNSIFAPLVIHHYFACFFEPVHAVLNSFK